jgi:hypothetical protein
MDTLKVKFSLLVYICIIYIRIMNRTWYFSDERLTATHMERKIYKFHFEPISTDTEIPRNK